jgi:hypothetical protein
MSKGTLSRPQAGSVQRTARRGCAGGSAADERLHLYFGGRFASFGEFSLREGGFPPAREISQFSSVQFTRKTPRAAPVQAQRKNTTRMLSTDYSILPQARKNPPAELNVKRETEKAKGKAVPYRGFRLQRRE